MRSLARHHALLVLALLLLHGCSSSTGSICENACRKLHDCGFRQMHLTSVNTYSFGEDCGAVACDRITECVAGCVMTAGCGELDPVPLGGKLHLCMISCNGWFRTPDGG